MSISRAFQSGKALQLDLLDQIVSFEQMSAGAI